MNWKKNLFGLCLSAFTITAGVGLFSGTAVATEDTVAVNVDASSVLVASDITVATGVTTVEAGWEEGDDGNSRRYHLEDGTYATGTLEIDGVLYCFDSEGFQKTGWQTVQGTRHYYDTTTGEAAIGEKKIDGMWYLFDNTGAQKLGWRTINGVRRYYNPETGKIQTGWIETGGYRYYATETGGKQCGEIEVNGIRYQMDETYGTQNLGFCTFSDKTVSYYGTDGKPVSGWQTIAGSKYYFNTNYIMQTGWQTISGSKYYFNANGVMQTGWQTISNKKYYFNTSGVMQTGWAEIQGNTYYFGENGVMQTNTSVWRDLGWHENDDINYGLYYQQEYYLQADGTAITMAAHLLNSVSLKSHKSFVVYNRQTATTSQWTCTLSDNDIKILEKFKKEHFTSDMTREEQLLTVWEWIHYNVSYAYAGDDWNSISDKSWVEAIFTYKKGQCAQYNGAMAAMMAYLGYDVNMVQGWVGSTDTQHFWTEVTIGGTSYLMETGNAGKNGMWSYFMIDYQSCDDALGYIQY